MTKRERRRIIFDACEVLELAEQGEPACILLDEIMGCAASPARRDFGSFYNKSARVIWNWGFSKLEYKQRNAQRIMALLFFEHIGLEGVL